MSIATFKVGDLHSRLLRCVLDFDEGTGDMGVVLWLAMWGFRNNDHDNNIR